MKKNIIHIVKAVLSSMIWGLGQVFNRQYFKALFFFVLFVGFIGIELGSGKYFATTDPYDKIAGEDYPDGLAASFYTNYNSDKNVGLIAAIPTFDQFYQTIEGPKLTMDELIRFIASDLDANNRVKYFAISEEFNASAANKGKDRPSDLYPDEDDIAIEGLTQVIVRQKLYSFGGNLYREVIEGFGNDRRVFYVNIADDSDKIEDSGMFDQLKLYDRTGNVFINITDQKIYMEVNDDSVFKYINLLDENDVLLARPLSFRTLLIKGTVWVSDTTVYEYFNPRIIGYKSTVFSNYFKTFMSNQYSKPGNSYNATDYTRFLFRTYLELNPDVKEDFEYRYNMFFYDQAGFFLKGYWSIITLGETGGTDYTDYIKLQQALVPQSVSSGILEITVVAGHESAFILIKGLISTLLSAYFIFAGIWNVIDAYKTSKKKTETGVYESDKEYFKKVYESSFEYIALLPALFTITFISIMPILFGFLIAFTNYNAKNLYVVDWVGFRNFLEIFNFGAASDIPFGRVFWQVFTWTMIWAIASTATVFFGGFFQAVIINNKRVVFRKIWRTVLILPWAVPALISQMVFRIMFNENGAINFFLKNVGVYDLLERWGWLGRNISEFSGAWEKLFYLGEQNIQWFTNPHNPWFVRISLIVVNIWLGFPYFMALMTGVMTSIDKTLYEAADIDGANNFQKFKLITFPLVLYSTAPILVMTFSGNFNNFGVIYFITQGGNGAGLVNRAFAGDTDILISWMYRLTVDDKIYNMASVFSILIFLIVGSLAAWNFTRTKSFKED